MAGRKLWSTRELEILRRDYPHLPTRVIAFRLRRQIAKIYAQASNLGLHKTVAFFANVKACGRFEKLSRAGERFRFQTGHVPANKGLRRPGWHSGRMRETQFKKGRRPHTWRPIGTTSVDPDGYLKRKVREHPYPPKAWKFVHRLLWEEHCGPIPRGHVVTFKDPAQKVPVLLGNLQLITMAENARRNRMWIRYPRDVAMAIHALGQTKRWLRVTTEHEQDH